MPPQTALTDWGRRVRAAAILRDASLDDLAGELNISRKTLERTMRGERAPRDWETMRVAQVLEIPEWFLTSGLDAPPAGDDLAARMERIENLLTGLVGDVDDLRRRSTGGP